ncbi:proteasome assembly chaperone 4 [Olea europaea subsp. europaea]|uniref:Proteasome assembly chaperone 4 n=1 Tax=Olea europaea subsp. europaea TaxID=158383 RepID=A0A8S0QEE8_OLEEU|nr:proteasome assembly chaperone 4 [Olea europaea subsp. europaea]
MLRLKFSDFLAQCNTVSVTSLIGGTSDNTGSGVAHRLVLRTGLNIILACNLSKNSPMLEADAERRLVQKLVSLGYTNQKM